MKLGKQPATQDDRDLRFAHYRVAPLPVLPSRFGYGYTFAKWGMLANDTVGDCVFAGAAHETMLWTKLGAPATALFTDQAVLADYSAVTGYNPADPNSDQGTDVRDALRYRKASGIRDARGGRHRISAYVALDPKDWDQLMEAVYIFGAVGIGFEFPDSAFDQFDNGQVWDVTHGATVVGGHYVPVLGTMARTRQCTFVTWGRRTVMTRAFYEAYNDESWAMLSTEVLSAEGKGLHGFDLVTLTADLQAL